MFKPKRPRDEEVDFKASSINTSAINASNVSQGVPATADVDLWLISCPRGKLSVTYRFFAFPASDVDPFAY